jgi:hypothetical protein
MSEKEQAPAQHENRDLRPIGRFLLGLESKAETDDLFLYAREFARRPGNFEKHKHKMRKIETSNAALIDDRGVQLEFMIDKFSYVWKITVAGEPHKIEDLRTSYNPHGGEQYELHCSVSKNIGYYREYGTQGNVIRQREFEDSEQLQILQGFVEHLL